MKESLMSTEYLKEIDLFGKKTCLNKKGNDFNDEGCIIINEILKKSKIERINLGRK
jgi:hypothetical protein